jgi:hypothetical protein
LIPQTLRLRGVTDPIRLRFVEDSVYTELLAAKARVYFGEAQIPQDQVEEKSAAPEASALT